MKKNTVSWLLSFLIAVLLAAGLYVPLAFYNVDISYLKVFFFSAGTMFPCLLFVVCLAVLVKELLLIIGKRRAKKSISVKEDAHESAEKALPRAKRIWPLSFAVPAVLVMTIMIIVECGDFRGYGVGFFFLLALLVLILGLCTGFTATYFALPPEEKAKRRQERAAVMQAQASTLRERGQEPPKCPTCGSTYLRAKEKGFGIGKAVIGAAAFGLIGLTAGNINAKKVYITCLNCGHRWTAGKG